MLQDGPLHHYMLSERNKVSKGFRLCVFLESLAKTNLLFSVFVKRLKIGMKELLEKFTVPNDDVVETVDLVTEL